MAKLYKLSDEERNYFDECAKAIFVNPFSDEWANIARKSMPQYRLSRNAQKEFFKLEGRQLSHRLQRLKEKGISRVEDFVQEDQHLMKYTYLFATFILFIDEIDELLERHLRHPKENAPAEFADDLLRQLQARGFSKKDSLRYFSIFYQIQRAFYFIAHALIGNSKPMIHLRLALWKAVLSSNIDNYDRHLWDRMEDFSTLLVGETGTGKGAAAESIGRSGFIPFCPESKCFTQNINETFVSTNISEIPESLIESELFGHRKGAFTGAIDKHEGLLARCHENGALFLDEIGDFSSTVQIKLLKVLQDRQYTPVGSHASQRFSGRVIAATNRSLTDMREEGSFRSDLFYRLCSDVIPLPSLRERISDSKGELELLVQALSRRMFGESSLDLVDYTMDRLNHDLPQDYPWPGNVRELEQAIRRIMITGHYHGDQQSLIKTSDLSEKDLLTAEQVLSQHCKSLYDKHGSYEKVAAVVQLDRRTVKKYVELCRK
jgi:transcriptional regulator of acetoin/glycerol metabolism